MRAATVRRRVSVPLGRVEFPLRATSQGATGEDISWFDCLNLPSIHDPEIDLYKEWHHFAFFVPEKRALGLANASLLGNLYDPARGTLVCTILVNVGGQWYGDVESRGVAFLRASGRGPNLAGRGVKVKFDGKAYRVKMRCDSDGSGVSAMLRPHALHQGGFVTMRGRGHLGWVAFPRLSADGFILAGRRRIRLSNSLAFHDHNWGRFRWGEPLSWDYGVFLETSGQNPTSLLFYKLYQSNQNEETDMSLFVYAGRYLQDRVFPPRLRVRWKGSYNGRTWRRPGVLSMLHPRTLAELPAQVNIEALTNSGLVRVAFAPRDAAIVIVPNRLAYGETVLCQCPGEIRVASKRRDGSGHFVGYMEFARPVL